MYRSCSDAAHCFAVSTCESYHFVACSVFISMLVWAVLALVVLGSSMHACSGQEQCVHRLCSGAAHCFSYFYTGCIIL